MIMGILFIVFILWGFFGMIVGVIHSIEGKQPSEIHKIIKYGPVIWIMEIINRLENPGG